MNDDFLTRKSENLKVPNMDLAVPLHLKGPTREKGMSRVCVISGHLHAVNV